MLAFEVRDACRPAPCVAVGFSVKVGLPRERFWCQVTAVRPDGMIEAVVDNDLVMVEGLRRGDKLTLSHDNVLESAGWLECQEVLRQWAMRGDVREMLREWEANGAPPEPMLQGALSWRAERLQAGLGVAPRPNTELAL